MKFKDIKVEQMNFDKEVILIKTALSLDEAYQIMKCFQNNFPDKTIIVLPKDDITIENKTLNGIIEYLQELKEKKDDYLR